MLGFPQRKFSKPESLLTLLKNVSFFFSSKYFNNLGACSEYYVKKLFRTLASFRFKSISQKSCQNPFKLLPMFLKVFWLYPCVIRIHYNHLCNFSEKVSSKVFFWNFIPTLCNKKNWVVWIDFAVWLHWVQWTELAAAGMIWHLLIAFGEI